MSIASYLSQLLNSSGLVPGSKIASGAIGLSQLTATGTPSSSNFLRGDNTWATPIGVASDRQVFNASGTWTKPSSGTYAVIQIWGSGAGGGGSTVGNATKAGGGGGGYSSTTCLLSDLAATVSITINGGGAGNGGNGTAGGSITFGSYLTHVGGNLATAFNIGCTTYIVSGRSGYLSSTSGLTLIAGNAEFSTVGNGTSFASYQQIGTNFATALPNNMYAPGNGGHGINYTAGGTSAFGGAGGAGGNTGTAGTAPGGGGGGGGSGNGGNGAIGRVIVTVF